MFTKASWVHLFDLCFFGFVVTVTEIIKVRSGQDKVRSGQDKVRSGQEIKITPVPCYCTM